MKLPIPDQLWTAFLEHLQGCPLGETSCPTCQDLLHQWGDADQMAAREQMAIDRAEGCWGTATDWPRLTEEDRVPDPGERTP